MIDSNNLEKTGTENKEKTLLEEVTQINKDHKMISKVADEEKLKTAEEEISNGIDRINTRIDEIKTEGKALGDVKKQRVLFDEYKNLEVQRDRLERKFKAINKTRTELTDKQKKFFGILNGPEESDSTDA